MIADLSISDFGFRIADLVVLAALLVATWRYRRWDTGYRKEGERARRVVMPELREREFRVALQVGEDNLLWRAVHQAIEAQREAALAAAVDIDNQERPALLSYYNGAAIHLEKLAEFLRDERERGLREIDDE
jgi:hypothetical protein